MKYSIIIPHYNSSETLLDLLYSIPARKDIEVIIIDDNSSSEDKTLLNEIEYDGNLTIFYNSFVNQGAGYCRNLGIEKSSGRWIIFADVDDFFMPEAFEIIDRCVNDDFDILYFNPTSLNVLKNITGSRHRDYSAIINNHLNRGYLDDVRFLFHVPWSKVFRAELIKKNGIKFDEIMVSNDVMFSTRSGFKSEKIDVLDYCIYCVTERRDSLTTKSSKPNLKVRYKVEIERSKFCKENGVLKYRASLISILFRYHGILKLGDVTNLVCLIFNSIITILPRLKLHQLLSKKLVKK
ncbi:glycosyltransferase family 2 protein [uncultured Vibrio sp.]|uniref:glycosyltransferase family 2 protein n=1 Tax=uncultured Vibrio sp. TaxID=114054 RepID=UPI00260F609F|nr:glycosyltransferase family 2 protein [uncultured Vibrio sp.]